MKKTPRKKFEPEATVLLDEYSDCPSKPATTFFIYTNWLNVSVGAILSDFVVANRKYQEHLSHLLAFRIHIYESS